MTTNPGNSPNQPGQSLPTAEDVLHFWFAELVPEQWFIKSLDLDQRMRARFLDLHRSVARAEMFAWRQTPEGRLAEIIVLDQFSRNLFRDHAQSFAYDSLALILAQEAVAAKADQDLDLQRRSFLYMPFMHSESATIHQRAVELFSQPGLETNLAFELKHKKIIDRFGRYPHRNQILGRVSSLEEIEFLQGPNSSF